LLQTRMIWKRNAISQPISTGKLAHCCASTPRLFRSDLLRAQKLVLRHDFLLDRLSAVTRSKRSYPAMLLAQQLVDQRFTIPGPLVQRNDSLSFKHPKKIGTVLPLGALNPTHVPLSSANSRTLGTFSSPRMRCIFAPCFHGNRLYHHLTQTKRESSACYGRGQTLRQPF
jgi:hypothetical protein